MDKMVGQTTKDYQWPEYMDPTLADGSGWNSCYPSSPSICADNPGGISCVPRYFPRGRPLRRRRLYPPPFNHYARGMRPQWSTPYYDYGFKWNSQPPPTLCSSPTYCYDHDSHVVETLTEKPPSSTTNKKSRRNKGSSQLPKSIQATQNCDQSISVSNGSELTENLDQSECFIPLDELSVGYQASDIMPKSSIPGTGSSFSNFCNPSVQCHKESSSPSLVCCNKSRANYPVQNDSSIFKPNNQELYSTCGKGDKLSTIMSATIFENSAPETIEESAVERSQDIYFAEEQDNSYQSIPAVARVYNSPQNVLFIRDSGESTLTQDPENSSQNQAHISCKTKSSSSNTVNVVPLNSRKETALAVFNLQELNSNPVSIVENNSFSSHYTSDINEVLNLKEHNNSDETTVNNSVIVYDSLIASKSTNDQSLIISDLITDTSVADVKDGKYTSGNNAHADSSMNDESISSLIQQNQLLTDLLSQLISGGIESHKNLFADIEVQDEQKSLDCINETKKVETTEMKCCLENPASKLSSTSECSILSHQSENNLLIRPRSFVNGDWIENYASPSSDSLRLSTNKDPKGFEEICGVSKTLSSYAVEESTTSNSLMLYGSNTIAFNEIYPSDIDLPSSGSESNHIEATLSSVTNYVLEEPVDKLANALISIFDDVGLADVLSSCVQPNSVLKVKRPRKRYEKVVKNIKLKTKKRIKKKSPSCKTQHNKNFIKLKNCESTRSIIEDKSPISTKFFCDVQTQVEEQDVVIKSKKEVRDVETQCGDVIELREEHATLDNVKNRTAQKDFLGMRTNTNNLVTDNNNEAGDRKDMPLVQTNPTSTDILDNEKKSSLDTLRVDLTEVGKIQNEYLESSEKPCPPTVKNVAVSYEQRLSSKPKSKHFEITRTAKDSTSVVKRRRRSNKEMETMTGECTSSDETQITFFLSHSVDRTLRKRKIMDYSEPRTKRMRMNSKLELDCDSTELFKDNEDQGRKKNLKDPELRICTRSHRLIRDRSNVTPCQLKRNEKITSCKRCRTKTG